MEVLATLAGDDLTANTRESQVIHSTDNALSAVFITLSVLLALALMIVMWQFRRYIRIQHAAVHKREMEMEPVDVAESAPMNSTIGLLGEDDDDDQYDDMYDQVDPQDVRTAMAKATPSEDGVALQYAVGDRVEFNTDPEDSDISSHMHKGTILELSASQITIQHGSGKSAAHFLDDIKILSSVHLD